MRPMPRSTYYTEKSHVAQALIQAPFSPSLIRSVEEGVWNREDERKLADREAESTYL